MTYFLFSIWFNFQTDLTAKDQEDIDKLQLEIRKYPIKKKKAGGGGIFFLKNFINFFLSCQKQFYINKCDTERVRAIEKFCMEKEICMNRDPKIAATKVSNMSRILSDLINNFFEYMGWKTLLCLFMYAKFHKK